MLRRPPRRRRRFLRGSCRLHLLSKTHLLPVQLDSRVYRMLLLKALHPLLLVRGHRLHRLPPGVLPPGVLHAKHRLAHFAVKTTQITLITFAVRVLLVVVAFVFLREVLFVDAVDRTTVLLVRPVVATRVVLQRLFVVAMRIRALAPATPFLNRETHSRVARLLC